jgi:hypothetical protein
MRRHKGQRIQDALVGHGSGLAVGCVGSERGRIGGRNRISGPMNNRGGNRPQGVVGWEGLFHVRSLVGFLRTGVQGGGRS